MRSVRIGESTSQSVDINMPNARKSNVMRTPILSPNNPPKSEPIRVAPSPKNCVLAFTRPSIGC